MFSLTALGATTSRNPWMSSGSTSSSSHRIARWCGTILARPARYSVNVRGLIPVRLARVCTPSCRSSISPPSFVCFGYGRPAMAGSVRRLLRIFHQNAKRPPPCHGSTVGMEVSRKGTRRGPGHQSAAQLGLYATWRQHSRRLRNGPCAWPSAWGSSSRRAPPGSCPGWCGSVACRHPVAGTVTRTNRRPS